MFAVGVLAFIFVDVMSTPSTGLISVSSGRAIPPVEQ
jgi:hypothetical protein